MATYVHSGSPGYVQTQPSPGYVQTQSSPGYTGVPLGQPQPALLQVQAVGPQPTQVRDEIPHRLALMILGIIQMAAGSVCFIFEIIGLIVGPIVLVFGVGVWAGVFFFVTGLLSLLAAHLNNRCLVVACLVMCIIGSIVAWIGMSVAGIEINFFSDNYRRISSGRQITIATTLVTNGQLTYEQVKASINIIVCIFEFVVTIVNASFICGCCQCCVPAEPRRPVAQQAYVTTTTTYAQQPIPMGPQPTASSHAAYPATPNPAFVGDRHADNPVYGNPSHANAGPGPLQSKSQTPAAGARSGEASGQNLTTPQPYEQSQQGRF